MTSRRHARTHRSRLRASDVARLGLTGLRARPMRAVLSALGIAIGIAAMVGVVGVSASSQARLQEQLRALGTNMLTARSGADLSGADLILPEDSVGRVRMIPGVTDAASTSTLSGVLSLIHILRDSGDKSSPLQAFQAIGRNDQLLWVSVSYVLYSIANVATTGFMIYLFKFVLRLPDSYSIVGIIAFVVGLIVTPLYPAINRRVPRRYLYLGGMVLMATAYILFILFSKNPTIVFIALVLFYLPATCIQMTAILTITDSVEYGQLKTGKRNEAVTLSVRPMLDKIAGALSNSIVGFVAIAAAMTNDVDPDLLTTANIETFKTAAFYAPLGVIVLAFLVFAFKVSLTEKKHGEIVEILKQNMSRADVTEG